MAALAASPALDAVDHVIHAAEGVAGYVQKGLQALKASPDVAALARVVPALVPFVEKLTAAIPVVGEIEAGLELAGFVADHWTALAALGAAVHFAPADGDELARIRGYLEEQ